MFDGEGGVGAWLAKDVSEESPGVLYGPETGVETRGAVVEVQGGGDHTLRVILETGVGTHRVNMKHCQNFGFIITLYLLAMTEDRGVGRG